MLWKRISLSQTMDVIFFSGMINHIIKSTKEEKSYLIHSMAVIPEKINVIHYTYIKKIDLIYIYIILNLQK